MSLVITLTLGGTLCALFRACTFSPSSILVLKAAVLCLLFNLAMTLSYITERKETKRFKNGTNQMYWIQINSNGNVNARSVMLIKGSKHENCTQIKGSMLRPHNGDYISSVFSPKTKAISSPI